MMGVICASDGGVKEAGHQQDKYKLKLMQVSFLLDQFVLGRLQRVRGMVHLPFVPFGLPFQFRAWRQKKEKKKPQNQMYLPEDVLPEHRLDNKARRSGNMSAFVGHKLLSRLCEDISHIKFLTSNFMSKQHQKK